MDTLENPGEAFFGLQYSWQEALRISSIRGQIAGEMITGICLSLLIAIAATIWFAIRCRKDLVHFFFRLRAERVDPDDDGTVHQAEEEK